jgi:hypothetical protein
MHGDYSRGHEPDRKRGRSYRRVLLQMGRPVLDSDVAATVDALLGEIRTSTRGLGCAAGSPDLGFLVTPGRLLVVPAEAHGALQVAAGTPNAWLDYRFRYLDRYPALRIAASGGGPARVTLPLLEPLDPAPARAALWARVEAPATIQVNGASVALTPDSPDVPQRFEFEPSGATRDVLDVQVADGDEVWLFLVEQDEAAGAEPAFSVAPGTYHLDGLVADARDGGAFPAVSFPEASGFPWTASPPVGPPLAGLLAPAGLAAGTRLVAYLEAHERHVTHVEDPGIREQALGPIDTSARTELLGQVKLAVLTGAGLPAGVAAAGLARAAFADVEVSAGLLTIDVLESTPTTDPCELPDVAGYSGADNRLYRVEVHRGGGLSQVQLKWSRDNGSELFAARFEAASGNLLFDAGTPLAAGDLVEVLSHVVDLGDDSLGQVSAGGFVPPRRAVGQLAQLAAVDVSGASDSDEVAFTLVEPDDATSAVSLDQRYGALDDAVLKLRRWHGVLDPQALAGAGAASPGPHVLEDGITVELSSTGSYRPGQYWQYEARVGRENANGPWRPQPHGPERRFAPLALLEHQGQTQPLRLLAWLDERFSCACELDADDVAFAGARVGSVSDTVQEAIEELFEKPPIIVDSSCGEIVARPANDLQAVFDTIPQGGDARLCLHPGTWTIGSTVEVADKGSLVITGAGEATRLEADGLDTVLRFSGCAGVRLHDVAVHGGLAAAAGDGLAGSLALIDCDEVELARVSASCGDAPSRRMSAVEVRSDRPEESVLPRVRVHDCRLEAGNAQVGLLVVNPLTADIEANLVSAPEHAFPLDAAVNDPHVAGVVGRRVIEEPAFGESDEFPNDFLLGGDNVWEQDPEDGRARVLVFLEEWGNQFIAFTTRTPLGSDAWRELLTANPLTGSWGQGRQAPDDWIRAGLRRLRAQLVWAMFALDGPNLSDTVRAQLEAHGNALKTAENEAAAGGQGIVVAGSGTRGRKASRNPIELDDANPHPDARVVGNRVAGFVQGIHVGTSRPLPAGSFGPSEPRLAYRATIADNTVHVRVPGLAGARHGIFVGNAFHARINGNTVQLVQAEGGAAVSLDAIRAHGWFGPLVQILQNSCFDTTNGVVAHALNPADAIAPGRAWAVESNAHMSGSGGGAAEQVNWQPWRRVGAAGQPGFQNGWSNFDANGDRAAGFRRDPAGVVHLEGVVAGGAVGQPMFALPPSFRPDHRGPDKNAHFPVVANGAFGFVLIPADGTVRLLTGSPAWVDVGSIQFRGA